MSMEIRARGIAHFGGVEAYERWLEEQREQSAAFAQKLKAERQEAEAKAAQERQAKQDAANAAELERVKAQARAGFVGTSAEFEKAWEGIKQAYQQRHALGAIGDTDALIARKRASGIY